MQAHSHQDALRHTHTHDAHRNLLALLQVEGDTAVGPDSSEMAGAHGAANGGSLQSHSLGHEAYSDGDDDADEEVSHASALLPCKGFNTGNNNRNELEQNAQVYPAALGC